MLWWNEFLILNLTRTGVMSLFQPKCARECVYVRLCVYKSKWANEQANEPPKQYQPFIITDMCTFFWMIKLSTESLANRPIQYIYIWKICEHISISMQNFYRTGRFTINYSTMLATSRRPKYIRRLNYNSNKEKKLSACAHST